MRSDASAFRAIVPPRSRAAIELEGLLAAEAIPTDRAEEWHAVASVLMVSSDGQILLARNSRGWGTAGGHIESDDPDLRHAARREAWEELSVEMDPDELVPLSFVPDAGRLPPAHGHYDFCFLRLVSGPVTAIAGDDVLDVAWFPFDALPPLNAHMAGHVDAARRALATPRIVLGEDGPGPVDRHAVRAIVEHDGRLLMLRSRQGDYKFPGGGVEPGEDDRTALARELREECGRELLAMDGPVLVVTERRADLVDADLRFAMESRYYRCTIGEQLAEPGLSDSEQAVGLASEWVPLDEATAANERATHADRPLPWVERELAVLRALPS